MNSLKQVNSRIKHTDIHISTSVTFKAL